MGPLRLQLPEMVAEEDGSPVMRGRLKVLGPDDAAQAADDEAGGLAEQKVAAEATHPGSNAAAADEGASDTAAEEGSTGGQTLQGGLPDDEVISSVLCGCFRDGFLGWLKGSCPKTMSATWLLGRQEGNADPPASQGGLSLSADRKAAHSHTLATTSCQRMQLCAQHGVHGPADLANGASALPHCTLVAPSR